MYYASEIVKKIETDTELRLRIALALKVGEQAIRNAVKRKGRILLNINAVNVIKEYMGLEEPQLFTTEPEQSLINKK